MNFWANIGVTALTTFAITGGGAFTAALTAATATGREPDKWSLIVAGLTGLVQAAHTVQKRLETPPQ